MFADVGRRVAELRESRGMTQEQLAERVDRWPRWVQAMEAGDANPTLSRLVELADALGVDVGALFERPTINRRGPGRPRKRRG